MRLLDLTLESAYANVALDEALLESAEQSPAERDILRLWEPRQTIVVIGRSSIVEQEVQVDFCRQNNIPIVRRASGGAAVVIGPGCLMYAVVLSLERWPALAMLDTAHEMILKRNSGALRSLGIETQIRGTSDLAVGDRKVSGNSMRRKRNWVLYHGTLLYALPTYLIQQCLGFPPRQPEYRQSRPHAEFVGNVSAPANELKKALVAAWDAKWFSPDWPADLTNQLVAQRYGRGSWNFAR